ncbi:hypothetical protein D9M71_516330 [compost metagenome]
MGGQAGTAHTDWKLGAKATDDPQDLALAGQVQAVAGFDLDTGNTIVEQALQAFGGAGEQFILARGTGGAHGAGNTTSGRGNLGVADAL